jgi:hypothetical protein
MKKEWLWGPGRIDPEFKDLSKYEYLARLAEIREKYLKKILNNLLNNLNPEDIPYVCRIEKSRYDLLIAFDRISDEEFKRPNKEIPACRNCPNEESCETKGICNNWSLADFAAHLLTHEEKNIDPDVNETLKHMAEHDETHLRQIQSIVGGLNRF